MSHKFLEPIKIGNQTVKNRVMFLAMAKNISNFDDSVSAKDIAYVESVAAGGVGLLVPGAMIVDPEWPSVLPLQPGIYDDRFIPGLRRLVLAAHKYDAKILFQLWHPGATNYSGIDPKTVDELTKDEIHAIQDKFVAAAKLLWPPVRTASSSKPVMAIWPASSFLLCSITALMSTAGIR